MDHSHDHHHPAPGIVPVVSAPGPSLLRMAAVERLGVVAVVAAALWGAVWWALS